MYKLVVLIFLNFFIISVTSSTWLLSSPVKNQKSYLDPRIIGGSDVQKQQFPFMVSIVYYGSHICGGSIINTKTILTAAHCLLSLKLRFTKIRISSKYRSSGGKLLTVESFKIHEEYNFRKMDYDIGLVRLTNELQYNEKIQPISLQQSNVKIQDKIKAVVLGWGAISAGIYPEILQYAQIEIMNNTGCNKYMHNSITDRMLCAGYLDGSKDACNLDSGGPLVANFKLIGIVSWGFDCASWNRLGVYSNVSNLRTWIEDTLFAEYFDNLPDIF